MHPLRAALTAGATALMGVALVVGAAPASAHPMPHSVVLLDVHEDSVAAQLQLPVDDLSLATGLDLRTDPEEAVLEHGSAFRKYLTAHVRPTSGDRAWSVEVGELSITAAEQAVTGPYQELVAELTLVPPPGADVRRFRLGYDVVVEQVVTHVVLVALRSDWATGQLGEEAGRELGVIRVDTKTMTVPALDVDLDDGSAWQGFVGMLGLGGRHIAEGTDHVLFLLTLLLPAPVLLARRRTWGRAAGPRATVVAITRTTLAFTVGHSVTLALGALGRFELPVRPVEALIAASILVSAVHAVRPLFPGREAIIAGSFGLVHGMAFSVALGELGLSTSDLVVSLLGFNLGIELVQLAVVAATLPALALLARDDVVYRAVRVGGAGLAAVAAFGWLLDRLGWSNPIATAADSLGGHGAWLVAGLWAGVVAVMAGRAVRGGTEPATGEFAARPLRESTHR